VVDFDHHQRGRSDVEAYSAYDRIAAMGPAVRSSCYGGFTFVTSHSVAKTVLRDHALFSSKYGHRIPDESGHAVPPEDYDPPLHDYYRAIMMEAVSPDRLMRLEPIIQHIVEEVLQDFYRSGGGDVKKGISSVLPFRVLEPLLGFSRSTVDELQRINQQSYITGPSSAHPAADERIRELISAEISTRPHGGYPDDDFVGQLMRSEVGSRPIEPGEILDILLTFAVSGYKTTMNSLSNLMWLLGAKPEMQDQLREEPGIAPKIIEEMLRLRSPSQSVARRVTSAGAVADVPVVAGHWVLVSIAAANRDAAVFPQPEEFDISRPIRGHLAFGWGVHQCLGAPLVRRELKMFLLALARLPRFVLAGEVGFDGIQGGTHLGPASVPIRFID
jgi:cytochrome P450